MITLCVVVPEHYENYAKIMLDSVFKFLNLISKIYIAVPTSEPNETIISREFKHGKEILKFTAPTKDVIMFGHSIGLHACLDKVETEYTMFSDPDIFYMYNADELYLELKNKFNLDYVGCSHHSATSNAYGFFPYLMSSLVKTNDLPPKNWMQGHLKYRGSCLMLENLNKEEEISYEIADGKYLLPGPIPEFSHKLPNVKPTVLFDTGNSLCLYGMEQNWKWLSFQTSDCHLYTNKYYRTSSSLKVREKFPPHNILWHSVRSGPEALGEKYKEFTHDFSNCSDSR